MGIYEELEKTSKKRNKIAFLFKKEGKIYSLSYKKLLELVKIFSFSLRELGLKKGDSVGICLPNCIEWVISDLACLKIGMITVPIPKSIPKNSLSYIIKDSKIKAVICNKKEFSKKLRKSKIKIIDVENFKNYFKKFENKAEKENDDNFRVNEEEIATICYTSGSTGNPKGVMLAHKNILFNVKNQPFVITEKDLVISYLPLSHMFERSFGYYAPLFSGATIVLCENHKEILDYCHDFKPTFLLSVPRVIDVINKKIEEDKRAKKLLRIPLLRKIVGFNLKKRLGGRLRFIVCGGAPLGDLGKKFSKIGIKIYEGYGTTETAPLISANYPGNNKFGSVGRPIKGVKIKIDNGKIYVKSPGLMKGYTSPTLTEKRFKNGWFDTGDLGFIDKDGFLFIKGRADDMIVLNTGKKTFPEQIEKLLNKIKGVEQSFVYGNNKPYLVALIFGKVIEEELKKDIEELNKKFQAHEKIKKFSIIEEPFTIENGLLTHTLKLKRKEIYNKYKKIIEKMYREDENKNIIW